MSSSSGPAVVRFTSIIFILLVCMQFMAMVTSQRSSFSSSSTTFTLGSSGDVTSRHHRTSDDTLTGGVVGSDTAGGEYDTYFADWGSLANRPTQPTCLDIPKNMTLCRNIGYHKMRLPNLLDHDTLDEALHQSKPWISLLNINCHSDTQLFLCSLFSPVCLDRPIYPCRSLCEKVKAGCADRMFRYGYKWPDMFLCEKFPLDNDMCITAQSGNHYDSRDNSICSACQQIKTYENILDNFCRADFALKTKIKKVQNSTIVCKKSKLYKVSKNLNSRDEKALERPKFEFDSKEGCCSGVGKKAPYLIMGLKKDNNFVPTFIMEWSMKTQAFKKAVNRFEGLDCSNPKIVSESMVVSVDGARKQDSPFPTKKTPNKNPKRRNKNRNSRKTRGGGNGGRQTGNKDKSLFSTSNANVTIIGGYSLANATRS